MATNILIVTGTAITLADTTDYAPTAARTLGTRTDQIDVTSLAAAAARQSTKIDFTATRAQLYGVTMNFELDADPTAGGSVDVYLCPSHSGTANVGNIAYTTGADAAYVGISGLTLAELYPHMQVVGKAAAGVQSDGDGIQSVFLGLFAPTHRYGNVVVVNSTDATFMDDADEFALSFQPIITQAQ